VRQRTQLLNALRGLLAEHGWVAPKGLFHAGTMFAKIEDPSCELPQSARDVFLVMIASVRALDERIHLLDREITKRAREDETARRLMTIPGIGPITATALLALAPAPESFRKGRDFAAWVGLTPLQRSTGGKTKLGSITRMGERTLRRLLILGSAAVVLQAARRGAPRGSWLEQMLARKPRMLVIVALANKTARIVWAVLARGEAYRAPAVA
jgi:transposase